jgi:hypothetical protein
MISMTLIEIASLFETRKLSVIEATGLEKDALHIYFGLALFLFVRLVWRARGGWLVAWLAVLAMACGGEWLDLTAEASRSAIQPDAAHWHDIWNTMFWPTVLLLVSRWLQPAAKAPADAPEDISGEDAERGLEQA